MEACGPQKGTCSNPGAGVPYSWPAVIVEASMVLPLPCQCIAMEEKSCFCRGGSEGRADGVDATGRVEEVVRPARAR